MIKWILPVFAGLIMQLPETAAQTQPNIVFILADDLGYGDLGCYGAEKIKTPRIDALARDGARFTSFYAGSTVCAPSRATLMTGQHTGHVLIRGNGEVPLPESDSILPQYLHKAGYINGMVGKWGLGQAHTSGAPEKKGWDFFSGLLHHVEGHYQKPDSGWQLLKGECRKVPIPDGLYSNDWLTREARRFISQQKKQPFFLYVAYTLPHAELKVPDEFLQPYLDKNGSSLFSPEKAHPAGQHYGPQPYPRAAYAAMVSQMDTYVGQLVDHLRKEGLLHNTLIVFTSDNGTHKEGGRTQSDAAYFRSSGPFRGVKRDLYEGGIRVPFVLYWKDKIKAGTVNDVAGAFWDLLPTLGEAAGMDPFHPTDGISLLPAIKGQPQQEHECLYWEFYEGGFRQAVRMGEWKAIRFYREDKPVRTELYNLVTDPAESKDIAAEHREMVTRLELQMDHEHKTSVHPKFQIR